MSFSWMTREIPETGNAAEIGLTGRGGRGKHWFSVRIKKTKYIFVYAFH
jgi:putative protein kinase ArgK-like GTPase of G3E family